MDVSNADGLRDALARLVRAEHTRVPAEARDAVLLDPARDAALARMVVDLADAVTTWDVSRGQAAGAAKPAEPSARRRVVEQVQEIAAAANDEAGTGRGFVIQQAGEELFEILAILSHVDLAPHVAGTDVLARLDSLLPDEQDRPSTADARELAAEAFTGQQLLERIADMAQAHEDGNFSPVGDDELDEIGGLAFDFTAAHRRLDTTLVDAGGTNGSVDADAATQLLFVR